MQSEIVVLLLDPTEEDRALVRSILGDRVGRLLEAANPTEAWELAKDCGQLSLMIAELTPELGEEILDLRDHLHQKIGLFSSVFCSYEDMTPFYPRINENERLFFKPMNHGVLIEWFEAVTGGAIPTPASENPATERPRKPLLPQPVNSVPPSIETEPIEVSDAVEETVARTESAPVELPEEALPTGTRLGDYQLLREIQQDKDFALYEAEQTSIGRRVALKTLYRKHRRDINWVQGFVDEASARASVNHPALSLVYECDQELGVNFYTLELVDAPSLSDLARRRSELGEETLWKIIESCSSALTYLKEQGMSHRPILSQSILMLKNGVPRIANPVKGRGKALTEAEERHQMELIAEAVLPFITSSSSLELSSLVERLGSDRIDAINTIDGLRKTLDASASALELTQEEVAIRNEKKKNRSAVIIGSVIGFFIIAGVAALLLMGTKPEIRELSSLSKIPSGVFPFQDGDEVRVEEFWIGQYEVTISDYAKFVEDLANHPEKRKQVAHPDQPETKETYLPAKWDQYYRAAMRNGSFYGGPIDPNCPVIGVDWWDAWSYAKWKGARLPTEQEWEKAARGRSGSRFPWGDEIIVENFNSGIDHDDTDTAKAATIDGYKYWCPVDAIAADESRYGVFGLAGNVSEWTDTWDSHPDSPDRKVPLKRGASFATKSGFDLTARRAAVSADEENFWTGFRIAADVENPEPLARVE